MAILNTKDTSPALQEEHRLSQTSLSDLNQDFDLWKEKAELIKTEPERWNLLQSDDKLSWCT